MDKVSFMWLLSGRRCTLAGRTKLYKHWLICDIGMDKKSCGQFSFTPAREMELSWWLKKKRQALTSDQRETWRKKDDVDSRGLIWRRRLSPLPSPWKVQHWSEMLTKKTHLRLFFPISRLVVQLSDGGVPVQCPGFKRARQCVENPRGSLTCCVSSRALWWMTLIFLSSSDYVYLDIFLMGFHLSSKYWTEQEGREGERERVNQRETNRARWTTRRKTDKWDTTEKDLQ